MELRRGELRSRSVPTVPIPILRIIDLRDEHGNPIQLADQYGKPVQLTDEYGNLMHLTGVATTHPGHTAVTGGGGFEPQRHEPPPPLQQEPQHQPHEENKRSSSSNSSSSEDDGQGGRRKKGLKEKIKEKLSVGKNEDKDETAHRSTPDAAMPESKTATTTLGQEKKGVFEKIKDKLNSRPSQ